MDGLQANNESKKLGRRHVMMGKNAGKKVHRPSKRDLKTRPGLMPVTSVSPGFANTSVISLMDKSGGCGDDLELRRRSAAPSIIGQNFAGNVLITLTVPVQLTTYSMSIIDQCEHSHKSCKRVALNIIFKFLITLPITSI